MTGPAVTVPVGPAGPDDALPGAGTVAYALAAGLAAHGVDRVFCVAGESYLGLLDALHGRPDVDVVTCRHEGSAGFMALADAKLTGRAGVCLVNRGPGATNASIALHSARQDGAPLLLVVGHVRTAEIGRESFQEVDHGLTFGDLAKGVWVLHDPARAAEALARALRVAESGTPGPVVLVVPEDVFGARTAASGVAAGGAGGAVGAGAGAADAGAGGWRRPVLPDPADVERVARALAAAERPLLIAGAGLDRPDGRDLLRAVAERYDLAVAAGNKRQHVFDNADPHYAGHLHLGTPAAQRAALSAADLVLAVGTRLDAVTTHRYTFPAAPEPRQPLVHVHPDPGRLGFACRPTWGLACDPVEFLRTLLAVSAPAGPVALAARRAWTAQLHEAEARAARWTPLTAPDGVVFGAVVSALDELTGGRATVTVDAGNFSSWVHRHYRFRGGRLLGIGSSAMGFGVPAAVAAALRRPAEPVIAFVGDGGFLMTGTELATAVARAARLVIVVADNGSYGTIRQHQEAAFPGRVVGTDLVNPDFAALAEAFGATGIGVGCDSDLPAALARALAADGPVVVSVATSLEWISAWQRLPEIAGGRLPAGGGPGHPAGDRTETRGGGAQQR